MSRLFTVAAMLVAVALLVLAGYAMRHRWLSPAAPTPPGVAGAAEHAGHEHEGDTALHLSPSAQRNIGLKLTQIKPQTFQRTLALPAMVAERPGRSQVEVTAPLTGVVTRIHAIEGQAVTPAQPLFDLRLTHEDLVTSQRDFLRSVEELDVVKAEVKRLGSIAQGVIEGRRLREQMYEQQKLEAALHAQRQGLLLHGLTAAQIDDISSSRKLLQGLTVVAPPYAEDAHREEIEHLYHVQHIRVRRGQHVSAGDALGTLADHCELFVEGQAFDEDAGKLIEVANNNLPVAVAPILEGGRRGPPAQLGILYLADEIEADSRVLHFYMKLPNEVIRDTNDEDRRFIGWKYRPGQRMQVLLPVEQWSDCIVLPVEAVAEEGAESFVFKKDGDAFVRVPVHVRYRDQSRVVLDDDGKLIGKIVAAAGAYQMQLSLRNQAGDQAGHGHMH